jgi:hypothetical protein
VGERDHVTTSKQLKGGRAVIDAPDVTDEAVSLTLHAGVGFESAFEHFGADPDNRFQSMQAKPVVNARLSVEALPGPTRLMFSAYARIAPRNYFPVSQQPEVTPRSAMYNHLMLGAGMIHAFGRIEPSASTWFGYGALLGVGYTTLDDDAKTLGEYRFATGFYLLVRYPLSRRVALEVGGHWLPFEPFKAYETDFLGAPRARTIYGVIAGGSLGMTFGF